ncbi:MAG: hypothetical protein M3P48_02985 [Actinomycetota bacterium]|nr:hypothetical protein [Actinomycetota bacterium]
MPLDRIGHPAAPLSALGEFAGERGHDRGVVGQLAGGVRQPEQGLEIEHDAASPRRQAPGEPSETSVAAGFALPPQSEL